jgi:hypothetical protein
MLNAIAVVRANRSVGTTQVGYRHRPDAACHERAHARRAGAAAQTAASDRIKA